MKVELIAITPNAEKVIESAGRTAYLSFDKETDARLVKASSEEETRVFRTDKHDELFNMEVGTSFQKEGKDWKVEKVWESSAEKFVEMIVRAGHLSVLEHASATFRIIGGSRAFTHQLVRHRMASFTQQSQRYVGEENFRTVEPPAIRDNEDAHRLFGECMQTTRDTYHRLQSMGIRNEDARFVLPNAIESEIVITADLREWRHILLLRGVPKAQWEIRQIAVEILRVLKEHIPSVFADLDVDSRGIIIQKDR